MQINHIFLAHTSRHLKFVISSYVDIVTKREVKKVKKALMDMRNIIVENSHLKKISNFFIIDKI